MKTVAQLSATEIREMAFRSAFRDHQQASTLANARS